MNNEELKHLQLKVRNQKITVATFQRKFNEATATIKLKDSGIIKLNAIIKSQNEDLKSKNEIIEKLQAEMEEALVQKTQVQALKEQLEKDSRKHSEQENKLKKEINELKKSPSLLKTKVKNQKENIASIEKKIKEATATIKVKTSKITNLQKTVKSHEEKLKSKDKIINNLQAQIDADSGKMKNTMQINEDRKNALLHQHSQVECLKQQLEKDAQAHSELEEELKKEINEMKDSYVLLQEQMRDRELEDTNVITDLKAKLEVKRQEKIDFVMKQMKSESKSRRVLSLINHQLNDFNGKFDSHTAKLKEINCKFDKQTMELQELHKQIEELKTENQALVGLYRSEKKLRQTFKSG